MNKRIFVFGSNMAGRHGAGSAKEALKNHGAIYGQGFGFQGNSFAIPTKDENFNVLSLSQIKVFIEAFLDLVTSNDEDYEYDITRIGCGLAGYDWDKDIRPLFPEILPLNCHFLNTSR